MLPITKTIVAVTPQSVTNAATAAGNIDRIGFDFAEVDFILGGGNAATNNPSVLKLAENDNTVVSSFADITEAVGDTAFTIPDIGTDTAASTVVKMRVDLRGRKRYLRASVSPITTQVLAVVATLSRGDETPATATPAGAATLVEF